LKSALVLIAGLLAPAHGWRSAFLVSAAGPLCAGVAVFLLLEQTRSEAKANMLFRSPLCFRSPPGAG